MKLLTILLVALWSLSGLVQAHIHSQKVKHFERAQLTLSTWISALVSSALVGVCGVFPLILNKYVRLDSGCKDKLAFKAVLSFAVGGLLGDVFLHLLPEAYGTRENGEGGTAIGIWVLMGLLSFLMVEKMMKMAEAEEDSAELCTETIKRGGAVLDYTKIHNNGNSNCSVSDFGNETIRRTHRSGCSDTTKPKTKSIESSKVHSHPSNSLATNSGTTTRWFDKDVSGYLNLVANSTDNFTHGLAIAASYVASPAVGMLTTLAILCHEIPHEVGDFAILLNSGFSLKEAAKAQMLTACGGLVGVVVGLTAEHISSASSWLLPFTAGGFLYIALVSIVPDLLEGVHNSLQHSVVELLALGVGVGIMALVTIVEKKSCAYMPPNPATT